VSGPRLQRRCLLPMEGPRGSPTLTTGQYFLHSCLHFLGLHLRATGGGERRPRGCSAGRAARARAATCPRSRWRYASASPPAPSCCSWAPSWREQADAWRQERPLSARSSSRGAEDRRWRGWRTPSWPSRHCTGALVFLGGAGGRQPACPSPPPPPRRSARHGGDGTSHRRGARSRGLPPSRTCCRHLLQQSRRAAHGLGRRRRGGFRCRGGRGRLASPSRVSVSRGAPYRACSAPGTRPGDGRCGCPRWSSREAVRSAITQKPNIEPGGLASRGWHSAAAGCTRQLPGQLQRLASAAVGCAPAGSWAWCSKCGGGATGRVHAPLPPAHGVRWRLAGRTGLCFTGTCDMHVHISLAGGPSGVIAARCGAALIARR
jgi:hypothetical protein